MELPVYVFTGFLDSGKSTFLQSTLEDKRFNNGERTLVLLCEEGEVELDPARFSGKNVTIQVIDDKTQFTPENLTAMQKKCRAQRVMVEYNGMWLLNDFYANMPKNWIIYQEMMFADANTFEAYNANMRNLAVDKLQGAQLVVFNRAQKGFDKMALHKIVRGVSRRVDIAYEYGEDDVEYDDIEDPLPFDKEAEVIEVEDRDFALWYRDLSEDLEAYNGKTVRFKGQAVVEKSIPKGCFIVGRPLMTCCVDDIQFAGLVCEWPEIQGLSNRMWVQVKATISIRKHPCYGRVGPVLSGLMVEQTTAPEDEVATFY
ncbi:MAG: GTPase [Ruminococcaceae bacterium]|nr:GTPase [Oscillospiraceae bacterium]